MLERFLTDSSRFVTALSERRDDLSALIGNLNQTTRALGTEKAALAEAIERLPPFMRRANTTYVNLRGTLDELDPFVNASKPVARKLRPYLAELRPFAREAVPTVRDLRRTVRRPGRRQRPVRAPAHLSAARGDRPGGEAAQHRLRHRRAGRGRDPRRLPGAVRGAADSIEILAHGRPYTPDFVGWMDDFSHTGTYDALGSFSRAQIYFNAFTLQDGLPAGDLLDPATQGQAFKSLARLRQVKRCPGAAEEAAADGSNVFSEAEQRALDCRESDRATGPLP